MKKIVIIVGKSGCGKSVIKKLLLSLNKEYSEVITSTTRPPREREVDGIDYHFYTGKEMRDKIFEDEMAECVIFRDWVYGTERAALKDDVINIGVWNLEGAATLNDEKEYDCLNIFVDCDDKTRLINSLNRDKSVDVGEVIRRYSADEKDFDSMDEQIPEYIRVNNGENVNLMKLAMIIEAKINMYFSSCPDR